MRPDSTEGTDRSPKTRAGRTSDDSGHRRNPLALGFVAERPTRGNPDAIPLSLVGESTFKLRSCIHRPLWCAAVWQLLHSRVGGRLATTTTQSEAFSESLPQAPGSRRGRLGSCRSGLCVNVCAAPRSTGIQADALVAVAHRCSGPEGALLPGARSSDLVSTIEAR